MEHAATLISRLRRKSSDFRNGRHIFGESFQGRPEGDVHGHCGLANYHADGNGKIHGRNHETGNGDAGKSNGESAMQHVFLERGFSQHHSGVWGNRGHYRKHVTGTAANCEMKSRFGVSTATLLP